MLSTIYGESVDTLDTAILIKEDSFNEDSIESFYINPLEQQGINPNRLCAVSLFYNEDRKVNAVEAKAHIQHLLAKVDELGVTTLYVADSTYFKYIAKVVKVANEKGYAKECPWEGYGHIKVILGTNYHAIGHNPNAQKDVDLSIDTLAGQLGSTAVTKLGAGIIHFSEYPSTVDDIASWFKKLLSKPHLTYDIETYDATGSALRFDKNRIATIAFAWDKHSGVAFDICHTRTDPDEISAIEALIKEFFELYDGQLTAHNRLFDDKVLIHHYWMENDSDWAGMRRGLSAFEQNDDTTVIAYLATNNTVENILSLKELSYEHTGAYAVDVKDIQSVGLTELLTYNLKDCLATHYVYAKYVPQMEEDKQREFYDTIAKPSLRSSIKMMLTGIPMDMDKVEEAKRTIGRIYRKHVDYLTHDKYVKDTQLRTNKRTWTTANSKLKKKSKPLSELTSKFNPNSASQLQDLLYEVMGLPVLDTTDSGMPSTSSKAISKLLKREDTQKYSRTLTALVEVSKSSKILGTFISAFEDYAFTRKEGALDGTSWLNGNLKTTGTKSGRFSSSEPNLQNLPSGSDYGKAIKSCFVAPEGWLFTGADFASLEDRIIALLTRDPEKMKVYLDGYDGHSLRAFRYYGEQMPLVMEQLDLLRMSTSKEVIIGKYEDNSVKVLDHVDTPDCRVTVLSKALARAAIINSIADLYPDLRARSKSPTFALVYGGTHHTLVTNLGFSQEEAIALEESYHDLYAVSDVEAERVVSSASRKGYTECAFGLRLRTPTLAGTDMSQRCIPPKASAEGRTANNANSQSYGLLINRAINATEALIEASPYRDDIIIMNTIHDAVYYMVREDPAVVKFLNDTLIREMEWNDLDPIRSKDIPMTAQLDVGASWADQNTLHNNATLEEVTAFLQKIKGD